MKPLLSVDQVYKYFGGVRANENISMQVEQGSIVGLIGPNGSGKTTLFNSIAGTHPIDKGSIKFENKEVSTLPVPVILNRFLAELLVFLLGILCPFGFHINF